MNASATCSLPFSCFQQLAGQFLHVSEFKPTTARTYRSTFSSFFSWLSTTGDPLPAKEHIILWKAFLGKNRSLATIQTYLAAIRLFFKWTEQQGIYPDITLSIKGIRVGRFPRKDFLTPKQVLSLLDKATQGKTALRDYALILLMVTCGLRVSEAAKANIGDLRHIGGKPVLYIYGKGRDGKTESVNVPGKAVSAITRYLATRPALTPHSPLFASAGRNNPGGHLSARSISRIIKTLLLSCGINNSQLTAHSLRHTAVTLSLKAGATLQQVQQFARHSLIITTQIYAHNLDRLRNPCSNKISRFLFQENRIHQEKDTSPGIINTVPHPALAFPLC
ncbi:MAG: site-specific integrase [Alistipes senegalensis]|nr:site-specific integrase [Alistipes senegalensis]